MKAYKGFNADMTCRGFKYEEGKKYKTDTAKVCETGFHACEHPLDCLGYYAPGDGSVYHEVELDGEIDKESNGDTKVAATKIKIGARLSIAGLVKAAIDYTWSRIRTEAKADEDNGAASATGDSGAASATGYSGAASATGDSGAASATGYSGAASATGYSGAASATGYSGAASAENPTAIAVAWGICGRAKGVKGSHIVLADWRRIKSFAGWYFYGAKMVRIDDKTYMSDTWYTMKDGEIVKAED